MKIKKWNLVVYIFFLNRRDDKVVINSHTQSGGGKGFKPVDNVP